MKSFIRLFSLGLLAVVMVVGVVFSANAYDPSASQNWSREAARRAQTYQNIKPYNYNRNRRRMKAPTARKRVRRRKAPIARKRVRVRKAARKPSYRYKSKAKDCTPYNGPDGYYGNPWCEGGFVLP